MKKVLIVNNNMHIGGVQRALVSLLWQLQGSCDVTLLLFSPVGKCMEELPPSVKVITADSPYRFLGQTKYDLHSTADRLGRGFYAGITRLFGRKYALSLMGLGQKRLEGYDAAISYLHDGAPKAFYGGCSEFVLRHVSAKRKIAFLHCDWGLCGADTPENNRRYAEFDRIAACSQGCADAFLKCNPRLADKVAVVPNCHRFDRIRDSEPARELKKEPGKIHVLTLARLGREKGVDRALEAIARLGDCREKLRYHVVGDGILRETLEEFIRNKGLENTVTLWGEKNMPWGFLRQADLLLIPSRSEAAPLVIGEAACLGTPILSTRTSSAEEMIENPGYGWVCENTVEAMTAALSELLNNPEQIQAKHRALSGLAFDNTRAMEAFTELLR